jgi:hypothetical protein
MNDWYNTPQEQVNTFIFDAAHSGLRSKKIGDYTLSIPIIPNDSKQQGDYSFYNNSNFTLTDKNGTMRQGAQAFNLLMQLKEKGAF